MNRPQLKIRLPEDVKAFIEAQAQANTSSQSSEIVRAIRFVMNGKTHDGASVQNAEAR